MKIKYGIVLATLVVSVLLAGCGDKKDSKAETTAPTGVPGQPPAVSGSIGERPTIANPSGDPPELLVSKDIKVGTGKKAREGDTVSVQYVGVSWSTGDEFDASWNRGQPFELTLKPDAPVIKGWIEGVRGMRIGGRRELVIPPYLGYGAEGSPPAIAANETLVFAIDLESIK